MLRWPYSATCSVRNETLKAAQHKGRCLRSSERKLVHLEQFTLSLFSSRSMARGELMPIVDAASHGAPHLMLEKGLPLSRRLPPNKEDQMFMPAWLRTVVIVIFNFGTSILLVNSVKYLYTFSGFEFPLFIASMHMVFSWALTAFIVHCSEDSGDKVLMPSDERLRKVLPFTILQAASLACANVALTHIYPSYHEMIQSTTPLFTLVSSMIFDGRRYNCCAYWAMLPVCGGAVISSWSEANFSLLGSALSALAVAFRALKTILQGRLLCEQKVDSITLCYYMAPYNLAIFSFASAAVEGIQPVRQLLGFDSTFVEQVYLAGSLLTSCTLACAFNVASYLIIKHMSPVGATVIANAKTPATILTSVFIFGNSVGALQILGFAVTILGVWLHSQKGRAIKV
ncbi:unnamed protein product [Symbiodinium sp. CCMP2456]|nr:unnamed protein product [Symbiodinium sp. CCMP2456]